MEAFFKEHGEPLFSSHMLDLSEAYVYSNVSGQIFGYTSVLEARYSNVLAYFVYDIWYKDLLKPFS